MFFELSSADSEALALDDLSQQRTWEQLAERSTRLAHLIRDELEVAEGEHIAALMQNRIEYIELTLAAMLAGVWLTPINWHLRPEEMRYIIADSGAKVLFCDAEFRETSAQTGVAKVVCAGDELDRLLAATSCEEFDLEAPPGAMMIYTSGTTGRPKGVKRSKPASIAKAFETWRKTGHVLGFDGSGPHLITGPMYHAAPLLFAICDLMNGAPLIVMQRWDDAQALALLQEREIHHTHFVPTMFTRLRKLPEATRAKFHAPQLHLVLHGAAPISIALKKEMIEWWGPSLVEYWGATEGGFCTLIDTKEWLTHLGSVGRAAEFFEVFAVDENGAQLPAGEVGDLYCRHKTLERPFEYHGDPEKTAKAYLAPNTYTIGDVGYVEEDGFVYLCDRRSNMIISGGVNIYPAEIELVLQDHLAIADVGVFGIPDEEWGESVKAVVALNEGARPSPELEAEILRFARERLAGYKVPRSIDFEAELPRTPMGKLNLGLFKDRYWKGRERKI